MPVRYFDLGPDKRISDIVFAGSHDASITGGSANAQTQTFDIAKQAEHGVRLFDLRILARSQPGDSASLVGYHGSAKKAKTKDMTSTHSGKTHSVKVSKGMKAGTFGLSLSTMLTQAKKFVTDTNEFLIFKFDKSTNLPLIAEYCTTLLGDSIYKPIGIEFGKLSLNDLKHKVVCVFNDSELSEIRDLGSADGILGFRNLKAKKGAPKAYVAGYPGLQYFGKGGTNPFAIWKTQQGKISENVAKQKKLMGKMAAETSPQAPDVLGMMYWTSTGSVSSIRSRNDVMWNSSGVRRMQELWRNGLESSVGHQLEQDKIKCLQYGGDSQRRIKAFFPNIIMIDFADPGKCQTIYDLNTAADERLKRAYDAYMG